MNTKRLGNIGEIKTLAKFVEMLIPVYLAFGDVEKADLVADFNGKLNKILVKTSEIFEDGSFKVDLTSSTIRKKLIINISIQLMKLIILLFIIYSLILYYYFQLKNLKGKLPLK